MCVLHFTILLSLYKSSTWFVEGPNGLGNGMSAIGDCVVRVWPRHYGLCLRIFSPCKVASYSRSALQL